MATENQSTQYLVEIWERGESAASGGARFIGNGGIVEGHLVTAAHNVFNNEANLLNTEPLQGEALEAPLRGSLSGRYIPPRYYNFTRRLDSSDIAEVYVSSGEDGLSIAEDVDLREPVYIAGSITGQEFAITASIENITDEDTGEEWSEKQGDTIVKLRRRQRIELLGVTETDTLFPGASGSLIRDAQNRVIGVFTAGPWYVPQNGARELTGESLGR